MRYLSAFIISLVVSNLVYGDNMEEIPGKNIGLESLEEMFENIGNQTSWDVSGNMLWGYFFTHHEPVKLEEAAKELNAKGYRVVDIYLSEKEEPTDPDLFWLHVEKIEIHSAKSLDARNNEFFIFAHEFGLDSYDGMDVGPVAN